MHLVTGHKGEEHIMSADQGSFNASFFGTGQYVMEAGSMLEATIIDNNTVRIYDGDLLMYGRHARIEPNTYRDLTIQTGTAGVNRYDLICVSYTKNTNDGTEDTPLQVIRGTESESIPDLPAYTNGNILEGATFNQMPLYKVVIEGVVLKELVPLFTTIPTYKALAEKYAAAFQQACETFLGALNIYDTMEEIEANTQENQLAGALAVKGLMQRVNDIDLSANRITYDNTSSELESTDTQGAIDELKGIIEDVNENFSQAHEALVAALQYSGLGITNETTFAEITDILSGVYPEYLSLLSSGWTVTTTYAGARKTQYSGTDKVYLYSQPHNKNYDNVTANTYYTSPTFDITQFKTLDIAGVYSNNDGSYYQYIELIVNGSTVNLFTCNNLNVINGTISKTVDVSSYTGNAQLRIRHTVYWSLDINDYKIQTTLTKALLKA